MLTAPLSASTRHVCRAAGRLGGIRPRGSDFRKSKFAMARLVTPKYNQSPPSGSDVAVGGQRNVRRSGVPREPAYKLTPKRCPTRAGRLKAATSRATPSSSRPKNGMT